MYYLPTTLYSGYCNYLHFTEKEIEAQRSGVICPRSHTAEHFLQASDHVLPMKQAASGSTKRFTTYQCVT